MSFGVPWLLAGMLLAAIPVIVHLVNRRRAVRIRFAAIELLRRSQQQTARHIKVKQRLLLALRVALLLLLPVAMAQPFLTASTDLAAGSDRLPAAVVIVLDDSASMSTPVGTGTAWTAAQAAAVEVIEGLRAWDQVAVVVAGDEVVVPLATLSEQHALALDAVREHTPRWGRSDLSAALLVAQQVMATSQQPVRRAVVLTDNAASAWPSPATAPLGLGELTVIDVADPPSNLAVSELRWEEAPEAGAGAWRIEATVAREAALDPVEVEATLRVAGAPVATQVASLTDQQVSVAFTHPFGDGDVPIAFSVEVRDPVGSSLDNVRWGLVSPRAAARVLLVNGDARSVQYNDELFFAQRALEAPVGGRIAVELTSTTPESLGSTQLDAFDVVVLANVASVNVPEAARLLAFVSAGGGLLVTGGDRVDAASYNATMGALLPRPLRDVRTLGRYGDPDLAIRATRIADVDSRHPIFAVFASPGGETLQSASVWAYLLIEPGGDAAVQTLATLGDGAPVLLERVVGGGSVILMTTSVDLDWTDLPVRTAYLPLLHRVIEHLARRSSGASDSAEVGTTRSLDVSTWRADSVTVERTDGARSTLLVEDGVARVPVGLAGLHTVSVIRTGEAPARAPLLDFVANPPGAESATSGLATDSVDRMMSEARTGLVSAEGARAAGRSLWPVLLFGVLVVLYIETAVAARRRVWERIAQRVRRRSPGRPATDGFGQ